MTFYHFVDIYSIFFIILNQLKMVYVMFVLISNCLSNILAS